MGKKKKKKKKKKKPKLADVTAVIYIPHLTLLGLWPKNWPINVHQGFHSGSYL